MKSRILQVIGECATFLTEAEVKLERKRPKEHSQLWLPLIHQRGVEDLDAATVVTEFFAIV